MAISTQAQVMINYILNKIITNKWRPDQQIPSENFFQIKFNLSKVVVSKTLAKLGRINLIYAKERIGYFVQKNNLQLIYKRESHTDGCVDYDYQFGSFLENYNLTEVKNLPFTNTNINPLIYSSKTYMFLKKYYSYQNEEKLIRKISYAHNSQKFLPKKGFNIKKPLFWNMLLANALPSKRLSFSQYVPQVPKQIREILKIPSNLGVILKYVILVAPNNEIIHSAKIWINPIYFSTERISNL